MLHRGRALGPDLRARGGRGPAHRHGGGLGRCGLRHALAESSPPDFRTYVSTDIIGVEIGGAVKNVIAVGAGLSDGLGFGANMRVALITRGLTEMTRLGVALGAQAEDLHGPRGSRRPGADQHRRPVAQSPLRAGAGRGLSVEQALQEIGQVVEGYHAARVLRGVAPRLQLDLPVCEGICRILFDGANAGDVVRDLMARPPQAEFE